MVEGVYFDNNYNICQSVFILKKYKSYVVHSDSQWFTKCEVCYYLLLYINLNVNLFSHFYNYNNKERKFNIDKY